MTNHANALSLICKKGYLLLTLCLPVFYGKLLLAVVLLAFSHAMLWRRPFFKFRKLWQILGLTLGGATLFLWLHLHGGPHV